VFGDVHDIGKSLVNTILTNNGYTVVDLGKQVPIGKILEAAQAHDATAIGLSALLVSPRSRCRCACRSCTRTGSSTRCSWAARRSTASSACGAVPRREGVRRRLRPRRLLLQGRLRGLAVMDQLVEPEGHRRLVAQVVEDARRLRETGEEEVVLDTTDDTVRSPAATDNPIPSRRSGACVRSRSTSTRSTRTSTRTCCSSCTGAGAA
jgi:5-methyltetrahydrofolate--homocysteine methyltransferase